MMCLITGEETDFKYRGKPIKREIYDIAKMARDDFQKANPDEKMTMGQAIDEVAEFMRDKFQEKIKDYKQELEKEVEELEKEQENESRRECEGSTKEQSDERNVLKFTSRQSDVEASSSRPE